MYRLGRVLTVVGICFCAMLVLAITIFIGGLLVFMAVDQERYFPEYVALQGYYPLVNVMFLINYILMGLGVCGIPALVTGIILRSIAKIKAEKDPE